MLKIKPQIYYWLFSAPILLFGIACLVSQLTSPDVVCGSYAGYVGGMWRDDEGFNFRTTPHRQYAEDILGLITPYMRIDKVYVSDVPA